MRTHEAFPSDYLKAADVEEADLTLTIKGCEIEELGQKRDRKPVISFRETHKKLVVNRTNWAQIEKLFGSDNSEDWEGKQVTLYAAEVDSFGETVPAIRVRSRKINPGPKSTTPSDSPIGPTEFWKLVKRQQMDPQEAQRLLSFHTDLEGRVDWRTAILSLGGKPEAA